MTTQYPDNARDVLLDMSDADAAQELGIDPGKAWRWRKALGLPTWSAIVREQARPLLGTMPDTEIAKRFDRSAAWVATQRKIHDVPAYRGQRYAKPYRQRLDERHPGILDVLGRETDQAVGDRYGLSKQRVHALRQKLGIEACHG